jgi:hypothetical protein
MKFPPLKITLVRCSIGEPKGTLAALTITLHTPSLSKDGERE